MFSTALPPRLVRLVIGLVLYGLAEALMISAGIGVSPWMVLSQGLAEVTGWGVGVLTNVVGLAVLLLWIPLRQRPGIGTLLNVLLVGTSIELGLWLLPSPAAWELGGWQIAAQAGFFAAGLGLLAIASGLYIGAGLGPGPRDGLMTGIHSRLGWPVWVGRTLVEATVLAVGWMLGGDAGIGTLAFALLIGPLCGLTLPLFARRVSAPAPAPAVLTSPRPPSPSPLPSRPASSREPA